MVLIMWLTHCDHQLNAVHDFNVLFVLYIWSTRSREF